MNVSNEPLPQMFVSGADDMYDEYYCGNILLWMKSKIVETVSNEAIIEFKSQEAVFHQHRGFNLKYSSSLGSESAVSFRIVYVFRSSNIVLKRLFQFAAV